MPPRRLHRWRPRRLHRWRRLRPVRPRQLRPRRPPRRVQARRGGLVNSGMLATRLRNDKQNFLMRGDLDPRGALRPHRQRTDGTASASALALHNARDTSRLDVAGLVSVVEVRPAGRCRGGTLRRRRVAASLAIGVRWSRASRTHRVHSRSHRAAYTRVCLLYTSPSPRD